MALNSNTSKFNISKFLDQTQFFKGLPEESRTLLSSRCVYREIKKKEILFEQGDEGHSMYLLVSGSIKLYKSATNHTLRAKSESDVEQIVLKIVQPGEIFAIVVLFERSTFPVSAQALLDSSVILIPKKAVHSLLDNVNFRNDFIAMLIKRQQYLAEKILTLSMGDLETKFFSFLEEHFGSAKEMTVEIPRKDIASAIGASPESLSRLIARLEAEAKLIWKGKQINLL